MGWGGSGKGGEIGGRIGWDVQVRQYTKGSPEITIFHSFARSNYFVQLKYRFSPPSPRLSRIRLSQSPSPLPLPFPPPLAFSSRATLHTVASTVPNPVILPLLTLAHPVIQPPLSLRHHSPLYFSFLSIAFSLSRSLLLPFFLSLSHSLLFLPPVSTYTISAPIFNYWLRERSRIARKKRETKSLTVSACIRTGACFIALLRLPSDCATKKRETERQRERKREKEKGKGWVGRRVGGVRRRVSWQKSETNEQCSVRRGFPCKCDRVRWVRGMGTVFAVTRNASKSPIESEVLKSKRDKRRMYCREQRTRGDYERCNLPARYWNLWRMRMACDAFIKCFLYLDNRT